MIKLEKIYASIADNPLNLGAYQIIEILLVLHWTHVISSDENKFISYMNNYINWDHFYQLYDLN